MRSARLDPRPAGAAAMDVPSLGAVFGAMGDGALSSREIDCLRLVATGLTDIGAARALGITHHTVRFHLQNACRKLGAVNRSAAIYRAAKTNRI